MEPAAYDLAERGPRRPAFVICMTETGDFAGRGVRRDRQGRPMVYLEPGSVTPVRIDLSSRIEAPGMGVRQATASPHGCSCDLQFTEEELVLTVWGVTAPPPDDYGAGAQPTGSVRLEIEFATGERLGFSVMVLAPVRQFADGQRHGAGFVRGIT